MACVRNEFELRCDDVRSRFCRILLRNVCDVAGENSLMKSSLFTFCTYCDMSNSVCCCVGSDGGLSPIWVPPSGRVVGPSDGRCLALKFAAATGTSTNDGATTTSLTGNECCTATDAAAIFDFCLAALRLAAFRSWSWHFWRSTRNSSSRANDVSGALVGLPFNTRSGDSGDR